MIVTWCIAATVCAAAMAVVLLTPSVLRSSGKLPPTKLWLLTLLVVPGQVLPPILLWLAWKRTYYIIPFLGPPILVGMAAVGWAAAALFSSYLPATVYVLRGRWHWFWLLVHPLETFRMLWRQWSTDHEIKLQKNVD